MSMNIIKRLFGLTVFGLTRVCLPETSADAVTTLLMHDLILKLFRRIIEGQVGYWGM
jgi:hypothetical protein